MAAFDALLIAANKDLTFVKKKKKIKAEKQSK